jgi:hypothetical protein
MPRIKLDLALETLKGMHALPMPQKDQKGSNFIEIYKKSLEVECRLGRVAPSGPEVMLKLAVQFVPSGWIEPSFAVSNRWEGNLN